MIKNIFLVFIGGGLGSICRYLISEIIYFKKFIFPYPTFITNLLGCFLIGLVLGWSIKNSNIDSSLIILFAVGFCGGFTTFSSFSYESLTLINNNQILNLFVYVFSSILIGIFSIFIGLKISKYL
tara:strand:+ start:2590 stop:2964 length:375 start_codon:yes stop_codon:yes gene_type:complete